jgi:putative zinc finger/helix-turn-helix YgiT family protein
MATKQLAGKIPKKGGTQDSKSRKCYDCGGVMNGTRTYYRYTECGLDSVTLENIIVYRCSCGAIVPEIPSIGALHREILLSVVKKNKLLSGQEIRFLRKMAGLSSKDLSSLLGASASTISRWENGSRRISKRSDAALRLVCFVGMLQEILGDRKLLDMVAESTQQMSEVNIREILSKITDVEGGSVPITIDPRELVQFGGGLASEEITPQIQ